MSDPVTSQFVGWAVALGAGLLIGAERERRNAGEPHHSPAGLRTHTLSALAGAAAASLGGVPMLAVTLASFALLVAIAYWSADEDDRGLTSEVALILTVLIGGLAMREPPVAAAVAVLVTLLLYARSALHRFVVAVLSEAEMYHALMFGAATLIVLPLLPDQAMGPFDAFNQRKVWMVVILVMAVGAAGHIATRLLGARWGLPVAGLASGFVSSTATIAAMGNVAGKRPQSLIGAVAGAMASNVATVVQMVLVLAATSLATLKAMAVPLAAAGLMALAYAGLFMWYALADDNESQPARGEPFSVKGALAFAATLAVILILAAALREWFGQAGVLIAAAVGGLADTHSSAISVASLVAGGKMPGDEAALPILAALTTNTLSKMVMAVSAGPRGYAWRVLPGLVLIALAAWAGWVAQSLLV